MVGVHVLLFSGAGYIVAGYSVVDYLVPTV